VKPLVVVEGSDRAFAQACREAVGDGVRFHQVRDEGEAAEALLAAVGGSGLVVHAMADRDVIDRLVDDLRRLCPVDHRTGEPEPGPGLTADERRLLEALANGGTLGEAATELHLSRRTADRRLASARTKLGAATTAEAVVAYAKSVRRFP